jgi:hypothetical protein
MQSVDQAQRKELRLSKSLDGKVIRERVKVNWRAIVLSALRLWETVEPSSSKLHHFFPAPHCLSVLRNWRSGGAEKRRLVPLKTLSVNRPGPNNRPNLQA